MTDILQQIPLFSSLTNEELEAIKRVSITKKFPKDQIILLEDEDGDTLFIILQGKVKVTTFSESGKEVIFSILNEGDFFGEMSLLDGKPRSATVVSMDNAKIQMIRRVEFYRLLEDHPRIALRLLEELASRLRKADERIESLAILDVTGRIAGILLQLADERGVRDTNEVLIKSRPTHQELANMVGTTRETVTRVLKQLEDKDYIMMNGKDVTIFNVEQFKHDLYF
ncbi:MAG: Crp/Fnr family transcriptional regulator [Candidatus Latescibacteria bacterium]|nr:Crp/Fnr family transcriptional regulator [Candidatus Latescibacterota bacterium]